MPSGRHTENTQLLENDRDDIQYFGAKAGEEYIAYVKIGAEGENFATKVKDMANICGAYCKPEYRGHGVYVELLNYLMKNLKDEGYIRLGVDFESINPTARGFWLKYFQDYTHSVVRRIDERVFI